MNPPSLPLLRPIGLARWLRPIAAALTLMTMACLRAADEKPATISHQILEKAFDGQHPVTTGTRIVDANSDLAITFAPPATVAPAAPSADWKKLNQMLATVEQAYKDVAALRARASHLNRADAQAVADLQAANDKFAQTMGGYLEQWQTALGLDGQDAAFNRILSGRFDGQGNALMPYANLARWIRAELERLNRDAIEFTSRHSVLVTVQAFHSPLGGTRQAVHVEGFDNIPAGELQPIDRTGLRLTPAEQAQLAMEIKMSDQAVSAIREIAKSSGELHDQLQTLLTQLKAHLATLEDQLNQGAADWAAKLFDAAQLQKLERLAQDSTASDEQRAAAAAVLKSLKDFKEDYDAINSIVLQIQVLRSSFATAEASSLNQLLVVANGLPARLKTFVDSATALKNHVAEWPARIEAMITGAPKIAARLALADAASLVPPELVAFGDTLKKDFPVTLGFVTQIRTMLNDQGLAEGADTLADAKLKPIWRDQTDLVPGFVELSRAGIAQGDEMMIRVGYRQKEASGAPGAVLATETYKLETELMGFHRKFGASVIFARGTGPTAAERQWKPSVAANVHWFYRRREPEGFWKAWNTINPGLGVHVATLNQGTDAVEIGVGPSLSLFDGILTAAYGRNLSNQQRPYYAFGLSLLDTIDQAKKMGGGAPH